MYKYYLALGSNLGETSKNIDTAIDKIKKQQQIKIKQKDKNFRIKISTV